jgi:hypothetical protein
MGSFSYNPGVVDQRGAYMAQGISQAAQAISSGITAYRQKVEDKQQEDAAIEWMTKNGAKYGINTLDEKEMKAAVKAAGGGKQAIQMISALQQQEQETKLREAQMQEIQATQAARTQRAKASAAAQAQVQFQRPRTLAEGAYVYNQANQSVTDQRDPTPDEAVMQYMKAGGDAPGAEDLSQAYQHLQALKDSGKPFQPSLVDLGNGVSAMTTSKGSAVPITKGATKPTTQSMNVGGRNLTVGPGNKYFDEQGQPVDFGSEKPMSATDWIISGQKPEGYKDYRDKFAVATGKDKAAAAGEPKEIKTQAEFDALKPGEPFSWNGRVGTKKKK